MNHESYRLPLITTDNETAMVPYDLDNPVNHAAKDCAEDCEFPE